MEQTVERFTRVRELTTTEVEKEIVMLDLPRSKYYGLNPVAATIWKTLDSPKAIDEICMALLERFEIDEHTCRAEVSEFLSQLCDAGIVQKTG